MPMDQHPPSASPRAPTQRFTDRAAVYHSARPSYPAAAIDALLAGLGDPFRLVVADVGAGTGISSRLLAGRGCRVLAIEPNPAMLATGSAELDPRITWHNATGERTGLDDASVDLVLCAQSFHWLREDHALKEFARILRPGGRAALVWNTQDTADTFTRGYHDLMLRCATDPPTSPSFAGVRTGLDPLAGWRVERHQFDNSQVLTRPALDDRARSASYCPTHGQAWEMLRRELDALFDAHARSGVVHLRYRVDLRLLEPTV